MHTKQQKGRGTLGTKEVATSHVTYMHTKQQEGRDTHGTKEVATSHVT